MEEIKERFDKNFKGQTKLSQSILSALEYRGFYDSGKYLDDDISERIAPIILAFIQSEIDLAVSKERELAMDILEKEKSTWANQSIGYKAVESIQMAFKERIINTK